MYLDQNFLAAANGFGIVCTKLKYTRWPKLAKLNGFHFPGCVADTEDKALARAFALSTLAGIAVCWSQPVSSNATF